MYKVSQSSGSITMQTQTSNSLLYDMTNHYCFISTPYSEYFHNKNTKLTRKVEHDSCLASFSLSIREKS